MSSPSPSRCHPGLGLLVFLPLALTAGCGSEGSPMDQGNSTTTATADYGLSASPSHITIEQGADGTTDVVITRTNFSWGEVTLATQDAPSGVTASFNPNPAAGDTATALVAIAGNLAPDEYTVTVLGRACTIRGLRLDECSTVDRTVDVDVTVTAPATPTSGRPR